MRDTEINEVPHKNKEGINLTSIFENLLRDNSSIPQETLSPPKICTDTSLSGNTSNVLCTSENLDNQDFEFLNILEDLLKSSDDFEKPVERAEGKTNDSIQNKTSIITDESRLSGYFCSETVFNLSNRVLSDAEIRVLEKGLDYAPIQRKINEPELRDDFNDFCTRMRLKWHFRDEPDTFSETPAFRPKSTWVPPKGHPCLEVFLSQVEAELFKMSSSSIRYSNMPKDEWDAVRSLADDRNIVIKRADKGSCVVIWDRNDYLLEAEKQLRDKKVYRDVEYNVNILKDLAEASNEMFSGLKRRGFITEKQLKYFTYEYRKATNFGKLYLLPKIHKRLFNVPGRPVISNYGTPAEKCSKFLDYYLKPVMQNSWSYLKDSGDFLKKMKNINSIHEDTILVTADVVSLYLTITHTVGHIEMH